MRTFKMLTKGCQGYFCAIKVSKMQEPDLKDIFVAREFPGVFQEVLGLPFDQQIEFMIELMPSTTPVSKGLYWMALAELAKLKTQLQELLDKGLI